MVQPVYGLQLEETIYEYQENRPLIMAVKCCLVASVALGVVSSAVSLAGAWIFDSEELACGGLISGGGALCGALGSYIILRRGDRQIDAAIDGARRAQYAAIPTPPHISSDSDEEFGDNNV